MVITAATIHGASNARRSSKRLGRGNASQKGTKAGRGGKGQTARSGGGSRSAIRALRPTLMRAPKLRGFHSIYPKKEVVTLSTLERVVANGDIVTPRYLKEKGVIDQIAHGVKIVGATAFTKKITVEGCLATKQAASLVEKAGGKIVF